MPNNPTTQNIIEKLDKQIRLSLVTAWELGKRQKLTPTKYNLDTDKLGQPIYDILQTAITTAKEGVVEKVMMIWAGDMMKVRMEFEIKEGSGTGKDEMPISYYKTLIKIMGDDVKKLLTTLKGNHEE